MNNNTKEFIEDNIDLLDSDPHEFYILALDDLYYDDLEDLIHVIMESDIPGPEWGIANFLMLGAIHENIEFSPNMVSSAGVWATWLSQGYSIASSYKDWANAAQLIPSRFTVYESPRGYEGDVHDYLILLRNTSLAKYIEVQNREIFDQTGDQDFFNLKDFKLVQRKV